MAGAIAEMFCSAALSGSLNTMEHIQTTNTLILIDKVQPVWYLIIKSIVFKCLNRILVVSGHRALRRHGVWIKHVTVPIPGNLQHLDIQIHNIRLERLICFSPSIAFTRLANDFYFTRFQSVAQSALREQSSSSTTNAFNILQSSFWFYPCLIHVYLLNLSSKSIASNLSSKSIFSIYLLNIAFKM